jgi:hypothetical protein
VEHPPEDPYHPDETLAEGDLADETPDDASPERDDDPGESELVIAEIVEADDDDAEDR